jgi:flagellar biogenesis protein FliO
MDFGQQFAGVAVTLVLLGGALWWLRRRGYAAMAGSRAGRQLQTLDRLALSPQHSLHLVRVGPAVVLLACSPGGCAVVRELAPETLDGGRA